MPPFNHPVKRAKSRLKPAPNFRRSRKVTLNWVELSKHLPSNLGVFDLITDFLQERQANLSFLFLGLIFGGITTAVLFLVSPKLIANLPLYQSYGPLVFLTIGTSGLSCGYLLNHLRRGVFFGLFCGLILLLHLQNVSVGIIELIAFCLFFLIIESLLVLIENFSSQNKSRHQHRHRRL